jgi:acyl-CoA reductase-like NAD-dependent aldehyde dehydrogenase
MDLKPQLAMPLKITKTPKCYVGGAFIRSESGRVTALHDGAGNFIANIPLCSRKDLRNAVEAAAKAGPGWAKRSAYNRGQILYRLAEMLEARAVEMMTAMISTEADMEQAARRNAAEVRAALDAIVHYAGWTDKYEAFLGSVNPVATPHFNFTVVEPMGVVGVIAPDDAPLLGLLAMILPAIASGNTVVALASEVSPYPAILLGEMLATSDLPGGVVNLLTGLRSELVPTFATHEHLRAVVAAVAQPEAVILEQGAAESVKRVVLHDPAKLAGAAGDSLQSIRETVEFKTVWHPVG